MHGSFSCIRHSYPDWGGECENCQSDFSFRTSSTSANPPFPPPPPPPFKGPSVYLPPPAHSSLFLFLFRSIFANGGGEGGEGIEELKSLGAYWVSDAQSSLSFFIAALACLLGNTHRFSPLPPPCAISGMSGERKISLSSPPPLFFLFYPRRHLPSCLGRGEVKS